MYYNERDEEERIEQKATLKRKTKELISTHSYHIDSLVSYLIALNIRTITHSNV